METLADALRNIWTMFVIILFGAMLASIFFVGN